MIFIQTITLVLIINSTPSGLWLAALFDPKLVWENHRLQILNYVIQIYLPIILICSILIIIGLLLNLSKRVLIKLGYSRQISDNEISKRKIIVKERGLTYLLQNNSTTVPYKPRFKLIHIPIVVFFIYTGILTIIGNSSGFNSEKTFYFIIQNYIPAILLCWIAFAVILLVTHLRKKLRNVDIKRF